MGEILKENTNMKTYECTDCGYQFEAPNVIDRAVIECPNDGLTYAYPTDWAVDQ